VAHVSRSQFSRLDTAISSGRSDGVTIADNTPTFGFDSEPDPTFECRIDDAGFAPCPNPYTLDALPDGERILRVRAIDTNLNADPVIGKREAKARAVQGVAAGHGRRRERLGREAGRLPRQALGRDAQACRNSRLASAFPCTSDAVPPDSNRRAARLRSAGLRRDGRGQL
jgi:hypothetical protein